jgi:hypothetical protein
VNRLSKRQVFRLSALGMAVALAANNIKLAHADTTTWLGSVGGSWSNGGNWSGGVSPSFVDVLIDGGNAAASLAILDTSATVTSLIIDSGDSLVSAGQVLTLNGPVTSNGTFVVNGGALIFSTDVTLGGTGQTVLNGGVIESSNGGAGNTLTIDTGHTLKGYGYLSAGYFGYYATSIVNKGTIFANNTSGNPLYFYGPSLNNSTGLIQVADGASFYVSNGTITGGTVQGFGTGTISGGGNFANLLVKGGVNLTGSSFTDVTFEDTNTVTGLVAFGGTITNKGTLALNGGGVTFGTDVTLAGSGQTVLNGGYIESSNGPVGNTLTIDTGHTLKGYGYLGGGYYGYNATSIVNKGTILADNTAGNILYFYGPSLNNSGGLIQVANGANFNVSSGTITGGTVQGFGTGTISGGGNFANLLIKGGVNLTGSSFTDVTFEDTNTVTGQVAIGGTLTNKGTLSLNGGAFIFGTDVTLAGSGQTVLNGGYIESSNGPVGNTLTIATGHTLKGYGQLGGGYYGYNATSVVNKGTIFADNAAGQPLYFYGPSLNNSAGLIRVADGASFYVSSGTITGGTVHGLGTGGATIGGGTYKDLTLTGQLQTNGTTIAGTITNNGILTLNGTLLTFNTDTTLTGSGQTVLNGGYIESSNGPAGNTLTIDTGHTLKGYGQLGGGYYGYNATSIVNKGTILADNTAGNYLNFHGPNLNNSAGLIQIADGANFYVSNGTVTGGMIQGLGTGGATIGGGTYKNLTLTGKLQANSTTLAGTITNNGTLTLNGGLGTTFNTDVTLGGSGQTVLKGAYIESSNGAAGNTLTIGAGHTLTGYGQLGGGYFGYNATRIVNNGTIRADNTGGSVLNIYGGDFKNRGTVQVDAGAQALFNSTNLVQDGASAKTIVNGTLNVAQLELQAGQLSGTGTISGDVVNTGGQVKPGASPGTLTIGGNYSQAPGGSLVIELDGADQGLSYDWLSIGGTASLAGDLYLDVGYTPADGTSFTILTALLGVTGAFDHIYANGWNVTTTYGSDNVMVTLTSAVPEPESILLLLAGLGVLGLKYRGLRQPKARC